MTVVLVSTLAALLVIAAAAAFVLLLERGRMLRGVNREYLTLLREQRARETEILDRVMYAAGNPWKDSADRDEPEPRREMFPEYAGLVEDPIGGASYDGLDELENLFAGNEAPPDVFATESLETL